MPRAERKRVSKVGSDLEKESVVFTRWHSGSRVSVLVAPGCRVRHTYSGLCLNKRALASPNRADRVLEVLRDQSCLS